jgi:DNA-binding MarR family transcriptional regulator
MARKDDDDDGASPAETLAKLERLARLLRQSGHAKGLNPVQWEALRYLERCNVLSHSPGAMAKYLSSTKGTVSQTIKALEKKGLLSKHVDPKDSRGVALYLTEAGRAVLADDDFGALTGPWRRCWNRRGSGRASPVLAPVSLAAIIAKRPQAPPPIA